MTRELAEETLPKELLRIEKHEERMMVAMVRLTTSNEKLTRRLADLTWNVPALTRVGRMS